MLGVRRAESREMDRSFVTTGGIEPQTFRF
jgi:hypothetical protein